MNLKLLADNIGTNVRTLEKHYAKFIQASRHALTEQAAPKLGLEPAKVVALR